MRIHEMQIDGFGRFAGRKFGPLEQPLTIFFGPNEAGKSTLLAFLRTILFGFPRARADGYYPPLAGGRHGGSVTLIGRDGLASVVSRFKGPRSGRVTLTSETGAPQDESALAQLLGNNAKEVFEQVFAFTLDELHSSDLLKDANVNSQIYSAGVGVASLPAAMKSVQSGREEIFLRQGRSQKIYSVHQELQELDAKLRIVEENAGTYAELAARQQEIETELERLAVRRRQIQSQIVHQTNLHRAWDPWNDLASAQQEIDSLPLIKSFPQDGVNRLEMLEERVTSARRERDSVEALAAEAERAAGFPVQHEAILEHASGVRRLQKGRTAFDGSIKDLPERQAELKAIERTLAEALEDLGPDWDERRLQAFDLSIAVRQEIGEHGDRLREADDALARHNASHDRNQDALDEAAAAEERADRALRSFNRPSLDAEQIRSRRGLIRSASARLSELDRRRQNASNLQSQLDGLERPSGEPDRSRTVAAAAGLVLGIALMVGGAVLAGTALYVGVAAAVALSALAVYLFLSGRNGLASAAESPLAAPLRQRLRRVNAEMQSFEAEMMREAATLGLETVGEASLLAAETALDEEADRLQAWTRLSEALDAARTLTNRRRTRSEHSAADVDAAREQCVAAQSEWQSWLNARSLLDTFTPETADLLQSRIDVGRATLNQVQSYRQRVSAIETDIDEYARIVQPLALSFGLAFDRSDGRGIAAAADRLVELQEKVQENVRRRSNASADLDAANRQLEERNRDLRRAQKQLAQLFLSGGAGDAEEFRRRAAQSERRARLENKLRNALDQLQRISGPGEPLESLKGELQDADPQSITAAIAALEEERTAVDKDHAALGREVGANRTKLDLLVGEEESSRMRIQRNILLEQLRGHARDWSRLTLAHNLLAEARRKFERERQPDVVRHAQDVFAAITAGRYRQVYAPLGEQTITVTDADGQRKQPSELSRGTREQLFLALRFGLIRELGQRTEPLPVIVDEVLVNFDPARALRAAAAFTQLSDTNQVLVFTCHPTVVEMFRDASSEAGAEEPAVLEFN